MELALAPFPNCAEDFSDFQITYPFSPRQLSNTYLPVIRFGGVQYSPKVKSLQRSQIQNHPKIAKPEVEGNPS